MTTIEVKERLPDWTNETFERFRMNQLTQILERRFLTVEDALIDLSFRLPDTGGGGEFAPLVHTHGISEITDFPADNVVFDPTPGQRSITGDIRLENLWDVDPTGITDESVIKYSTAANGGAGGWVIDSFAAAGNSLVSLTDTVISAPSNTDLLQYNGASWVNVDLASLGYLLRSGDTMSGNLNFPNSISARFGTSFNASIFWNGASLVNRLASGSWVVQLNTTENAITATTNGSVDLYHNNILNAGTLTAATGGFQANNTLTGGGLERVLTTSDLYTPLANWLDNGIVGEGYHNSILVAATLAAASGGFQVNNTLTGGGFERVLTVSDLYTPLTNWLDNGIVGEGYHNSILVAATLAAASGGFQINNTLTGAGFERVLTTSDLYTPLSNWLDNGIVGEGYHNSILVAETLAAASGGFRVNNTLTGAGLERVLTVSDSISPLTNWQDNGIVGEGYHNSILVAGTLAAASGGLQVNNTLTGAGFERVLTTSDSISALTNWQDNGIVGEGYHNSILVAETLAAASGGFRVNNTLTGAGLERVLTTSDSISALTNWIDNGLAGDGLYNSLLAIKTTASGVDIFDTAGSTPEFSLKRDDNIATTVLQSDGTDTYLRNKRVAGDIALTGVQTGIDGVVVDIVRGNPDSGVELNFNGLLKAGTRTTGFYINHATLDPTLTFQENGSSVASAFYDTSANDLKIRTLEAGGDLLLQVRNGADSAYQEVLIGKADGAVSLGYNDVETFRTQSDKVQVALSGTEWHEVPLEQSIIKEVATTRSSTTTLADDTDFVFTLPSTGWYAIEAFLRMTSSSATPDLKHAFAYSGTISTGGYTFSGSRNDGTAASGDNAGIITNVTVVDMNGTSAQGMRLQGFIEVTTTGDLSYQWAQNVSDATSSQVQVGSWMKVSYIAP